MIKESISITIPAFNEKGTIEQVTKDALEFLPNLTSDFEILIVDDGSTDGTGQIADDLTKEFPLVRVIHHKKNLGFSAAKETCYQKATKDLVFLIPADGQINISDLQKFVVAIKDADIVLGYHPRRADSFLRQANSRLFHLLCRLLFGINFKQISTSNLYRKKVLNSIDMNTRLVGATLEVEILYQAKRQDLKIKEVAIPHLPRRGGKAKGNNPKMIFNTLKELLKFWSQKDKLSLQQKVVNR